MDEKLLEFENNFSVLDRYGTDITKDEYVTNPAIGREQQIKELILILLTPEKSAILIGKPGIGKTAIVEGLAYKIQQDDVPDALRGYTIINIKTASLLGTMPSGESKVQKMIDELKTKEKVILFIDEIHMLIGATDSSSLDFANIFKEGLGRGSIKVIGATTTEEYERYILRDKAFTRRFQKVDVPEPSFDETVEIMMGTLPKFEHQTGVKMSYSPFIQKRIMTFLVDITSEYKRVYALGSRYPDVSLTLLKQAFSYAVYDSRDYMDIFDVRKAIEDTKNIYPDVKKKELPRFDDQFEDIILEEKGEKEIEPWRLDRKIKKEIEESKEEIEENPEMIVETYDKMIENQKKEQEVIGVVEHKKAEDVPRKKFKNDAKNLDDLLLTGDIGVLQDDKYGVRVPNIKVKINKELKKNQIDDVLLGGGIGSILDSNEEVAEIQTYKTDSKVNDSLLSEKGKNIILNDKINKTNKVDLYEDDEPIKPKNEHINEPKKYNTMVVNKEAPKKIEIDISKYLNRTDLTGDKPKESNKESLEDDSSGTGGNPVEVNEEQEENNIEEPKKESNASETKNIINEISKFLNDNIEKLEEESKKEKEEKKDKGDDPMYGQNYGGNIDFLMGNGNGGYSPNGGNDGYNSGMGMPNGQPQNNMDFLMGNNGNMPPYGQNNYGPGPNQGMMNQNMGFQPPPQNQFVQNGGMPPREENKRETLFGVPMYDDDKEKEIEGSNFGSGMQNGMQGMNDPFNNQRNDSFFGAPMYSNNEPTEGAFSKDNDIFGQLLLPDNNMRIQGGRITDDFSELKMPPSSGRMIIGDVMDNNGPQNNFGGNNPMMPQGPNPQFNGGMQNGYGQMDPGYGYGNGMPNNFNNGPMDQGYGYGAPNNYGNGPVDPGYGYGNGMPNNFNNGPMDPGYGYGNGMPNNYGNGPMDQGYGMGMNNYGQPNQLMPPPNNTGYPTGPQGYGQQGQMQMGGYLTPSQMNNGVPYAPYAIPKSPVFNELKVENNLLKKPSEMEDEDEEDEEEPKEKKPKKEKEDSEKEESEETKEKSKKDDKEDKEDEEEYVNYSDLKNGKVDQGDMEKYVSQKEDEKEDKDEEEEEKPIPRVDLNLENGASDDDYLD